MPTFTIYAALAAFAAALVALILYHFMVVVPALRRARELLAVAPPPQACRSARTTRLAATLSLLWRAHDHHRDLRAMEATTRATARARINRGHPVVTRHGLRSPHAATPPLRRMPPGTPFTKISANVLDISRGQIPILASTSAKYHSPSSRQRQRQRRAGCATISTEQKSKSP